MYELLIVYRCICYIIIITSVKCSVELLLRFKLCKINSISNRLAIWTESSFFCAIDFVCTSHCN